MATKIAKRPAKAAPKTKTTTSKAALVTSRQTVAAKKLVQPVPKEAIAVKPTTVKGVGIAVRARQRVARFVGSLAPLRSHFGLFTGIVVIFAAAQTTLWWRSNFGVYANAASFAVLVGIALWREAYRKLAISVAIAPVATMIVLSLPQSTAFAQAVVFYDALLLLTLVYRFWFAIDEPVPTTALTRRGYGLTLPLMMILGQVLGVIGYGVLRNHYPYRLVSLPLVASVSVVFAIAEEMFFRGLIQQRASKIMHPALAAILAAALYTLTSFDHVTPLVPAFAALMGVVLSFIYYKKQNLLLTITVNATAKLAYVGLLATFMFR